VSPPGSLPQGAWKLDASLPIRENEILITVDTLNIDSASFHQMMQSGGDKEAVSRIVLETVEQRGKQHNPVTGSGGMLLGTISEIESQWPNPQNLQVGDRIATLVSLSLTPLFIKKIVSVREDRDQIKIEGHAILFATSNLARIPEDLPESLSLAVLDVAGAPAQMLRLCKPATTIIIVGAGGKSGLLCCAAARSVLGKSGQLIGIEPGSRGRQRLTELGYCDVVLDLDATNALLVQKTIQELTGGKMADLVVNVANVENTEMSCVMSTHQQGTVYFFSMATSFTRVALGAEGISSDATLLIGNGYSPNNADIALDVLRSDPRLKALFTELYA